jgi:hypothetical protein
MGRGKGLTEWADLENRISLTFYRLSFEAIPNSFFPFRYLRPPVENLAAI